MSAGSAHHPHELSSAVAARFIDNSYLYQRVKSLYATQQKLAGIVNYFRSQRISMSHADAPGSRESVLLEVDRLFATLDGVRVSSELGEWSSRIQGIYADGPYVWVQLSHDDEDAQSVVLRLPRQTTVAEIIRAFQSVRFGEESSPVIRK